MTAGPWSLNLPEKKESDINVAQWIDPNTVALLYFKTPKEMGMNASTKYIFPLEFTSVLDHFVQGKKDE